MSEDAPVTGVTPPAVMSSFRIRSKLGRDRSARLISRTRPMNQEIAITEQQIDELVYELYGLAEEKVKMVQGGLN